MDFKKIYKRGLGVSVLLLIFIIGVLFIPNLNKKQLSDKNSLFTCGPDDNYEPNDTPSTAYNLTMWEDFWLSGINGFGILEDNDFYVIDVKMGFEHLQVNLTFAHSIGNIDIDLMDGAYMNVTGAQSMTDNEYIDIVVPSAGIYYIRLYGPNSSNTYDLWWKTFQMDDWMEENDDFWSAWYVDPNYYSGLKLVYSDDDWYRTYLNPGDIINIAIYFNHIEGDLELEIWDPSESLRMGSYTSDNDEFLTYIADMSGDWRIRVYHAFADSELYYDLDIWINGGPSGDDWMEENDDYWSASYVEPNYYSGLKLVYDDEDWFRTYLKNGDTLDVAIYFKHFEGDLELELWDPSEGFRRGSYSGDDDEYISFTVDMSGDWRYRVYHASASSELYYDLDIWVNGGEDLKDDWMEPNNGFWNSWNVDPGYYNDLILNNDDEDWFHTYVNEGDVIDVNIYFEHDKGNLELELWSPSQTLRAGSYCEDDYEYISFMVDMTGDWRVRVYHADTDSKVHYDLGIWIKDDFYEWNNNPQDMMWDGQLHMDHPAVLTQNERTWLSHLHGLAVQGDDDWYILDISPGFEHLILELTFNHSLGDIDIEVYDKGGSYIVGNFSITDNEYIDYFLPHPGIFAIHVYGNNMRNKYDMWWDDLRSDFRSDDNYEMNNDALSAYDISLYENISLWEMNGLALQYDEDWYEIYIDDTGLELIVAVIYDSAEGLMGFELYDWDLNKVTGNFTLEDNDYIIYPVSNGTYYIRVFGDNSGNVYNLWWGTRVPEEVGMIPGYVVFILIASILGISTVVIKIKRSKFKKK